MSSVAASPKEKPTEPQDFNRWQLILTPPFTKPQGKALLREVLSGITVALAQVPEAVSFSFIAGVSPLVGLQAAWIMCLLTALLGGAPGMISGATGALAVVMTQFVAENGVSYLFISVILMGMIQFVLGIIGAGRLIQFVGTPVMMGFCNGLAIVIFMAQFPSFKVPPGGWTGGCGNEANVTTENGTTPARLLSAGSSDAEWLDSETIGWQLLIVVVTMFVVYFLPKLIKSFPSSLAGILIGMAVEFAIVRPAGYCTPTVGDIASVEGQFPIPIWLDDRYDPPSLADSRTWEICIPLAFTLAIIGLVESLMTGQLVAELTDRPSIVARECMAQGTANIVTGIFGGMGGCAMIGQSMINVKSGAVTRIAGSVAGVFLLITLLAAHPLIDLIPIASLAGVMFMVVIHTFEWHTLAILAATILPQKWREHGRLRMLKKINRSDMLVIVAVTVVAVLTNLAYAVGAGVAFSALVFTWTEGTRMMVKPLTYTDVEEANVDEIMKLPSSDGENNNETSLRRRNVGQRSGLSPPKGYSVYEVTGPLFFASSQRFIEMFNYATDEDHVEIHFRDAQIVDYAGLTAINAVARKYQSIGKKFRIRFLEDKSLKVVKKASHLLYLYDKSLGNEVLSKELIDMSEIPSWTIRDDYVEEVADEQSVGTGSRTSMAGVTEKRDLSDSVEVNLN